LFPKTIVSYKLGLDEQGSKRAGKNRQLNSLFHGKCSPACIHNEHSCCLWGKNPRNTCFPS